MRTPTGTRAVHVVSLGLHVAAGALLTTFEVRRPPEPTVIEMRTIEKPRPKPPAPPAPVEAPSATPEPAPAKPARPKPTPAAAPPGPTAAPAGPAVPDFGIALSGGGSGGHGGVAVPTGHPGGAVRQAAKTLEAAAKPAGTPACEGGEAKARPLSMPHPAYTEQATAAQIEGKVRVQLTLGPDGRVIDAEVLEGLGHGLDEAALGAVRAARFAPATRCGVPVGSTFVIAVRFAL